MGQQECLRLLDKHRTKWWISKDIAEALDQSRGCTTTSLSKLYHSGFIKRRIERGNNYFYKAK